MEFEKLTKARILLITRALNEYYQTISKPEFASQLNALQVRQEYKQLLNLVQVHQIKIRLFGIDDWWKRRRLLPTKFTAIVSKMHELEQLLRLEIENKNKEKAVVYHQKFKETGILLSIKIFEEMYGISTFFYWDDFAILVKPGVILP